MAFFVMQILEFMLSLLCDSRVDWILATVRWLVGVNNDALNPVTKKNMVISIVKTPTSQNEYWQASGENVLRLSQFKYRI